MRGRKRSEYPFACAAPSYMDYARCQACSSCRASCIACAPSLRWRHLLNYFPQKGGASEQDGARRCVVRLDTFAVPLIHSSLRRRVLHLQCTETAREQHLRSTYRETTNSRYLHVWHAGCRDHDRCDCAGSQQAPHPASTQDRAQLDLAEVVVGMRSACWPQAERPAWKR